MQEARNLALEIARFATTDGAFKTAIPRLELLRASSPTPPVPLIYEPAVCVIAQGAKEVVAGGSALAYNRDTYLIVSIDIPIVARVLEASVAEPYLCIRVTFDRAMLSALLLEAGEQGVTSAPPLLGLAVSPVTAALLDTATRLVRLLESPRDIPILAPLVEREFLYRLLQGEQGFRLRQIARGEPRMEQVTRAVEWIKRHYREGFSIDQVAGAAMMSPSTLHEHFRAVTAMSPLQYQKQLRLHEARRLMLGGSHDAASAGYEVGYSSPSQFSREYRRQFGDPPSRDITRLQERSELAV
jgi:AraC-like DNA-binding protein